LSTLSRSTTEVSERYRSRLDTLPATGKTVARGWDENPQCPKQPANTRLWQNTRLSRRIRRKPHSIRAGPRHFFNWPEGQFHLATPCGEVKHYQCSVLHMKEYLELAPDSPDAQAAKDSIISWKDKLSAFQGAAMQDALAAQR
jgi:hypothetical protein